MAEIALPRVRRALLVAATPALKAMAFHTPPHYRALSRSQSYYKFVENTRPGDALLSRRNHELTNIIIPGYWKHAAMYVGAGRVIEAIGRGVIETSIEEFLQTKDAVALRRGKWSEALSTRAAEISKSFRGRPYDYLVEPNAEASLSRKVNDAFYCSEVVWAAHSKAHAEAGLVSPFEPRLTLQVMTTTPMDIYLADRCFSTPEEFPIR